VYGSEPSDGSSSYLLCRLCRKRRKAYQPSRSPGLSEKLCPGTWGNPGYRGLYPEPKEQYGSEDRSRIDDGERNRKRKLGAWKAGRILPEPEKRTYPEIFRRI